MITIGLSTAVAAPRRQVWEALSDPEQLVHWRPGAPQPLDPGCRYPCEGVSVRWRCRVHELPLVMSEKPLTVVPGSRLQCRVTLGLFRFEESFTLTSVEDDPAQTRLALKISAPNEMPLLGGTLDRFAVRAFATELAATYLQAVRDWCEAAQRCDRPFPSPPVPVATAAR